MDSSLTIEEYQRRFLIWEKLHGIAEPKHVAPNLLRELRIFGGAQGIWVDQEQTGSLTAEGHGVTVAVLHRGIRYADDLFDDGILYHYPRTNRPLARDQAEIAATKAAGVLGLPIFVITSPEPNSRFRSVKLGWLEGWDDSSELFLISFVESQPPLLTADSTDTEPFVLVDQPDARQQTINTRRGQQRFRFQVFQRYGACCAGCDINIQELLDTAHLRPKRDHGTDDPRNGLVLCALHHRALDLGYFAIEPDSLHIRTRASGPTRQELSITRVSISHLPRAPHQDALRWLWRRWAKSHARSQLQP